MHPAARWLLVAVLLVAIAVTVNWLVPAIGGHLAMGLAAGLVLGMGFVARAVGLVSSA